MSDPLSMFATEEEEDLEKIIDELNDDDDGTEQAVGDSAAVESNNPMSETNSPSLDTIQKPAVAAADDDDDDDEFLDNSRSGTTTQSTEGDSSAKLDRAQSATSELSETDLLAKIEAEMGIGNDTKDIDIVVDNPEKLVKTMESYIAFSVKTKTTRSEFEHPEYNVKRRYNDFLWLRQQLEEKYPYLIVPPLPEKHNLTIDRFDKEFVRFRLVALDRFITRIAQHPVSSADELLQTFLTLDYAEFQAHKKKGTGMLSRMTKSLSTMGGSFMLKNRSEEYTDIQNYTQSFGEKMGAFERISARIEEEQKEYLKAVSDYVPAYDNWAEGDESLNTTLATMSKLTSCLHDNQESLVTDSAHKVILPAKEYVLFAESIKSALARRDALQHDLEIVTEELVKCTEEKKKLEDETPGPGGFLSRSNTEEALKTKVEKLSTRIAELEGAHTHGKAKLEERNRRLKADLDRWHMNKKSDMKELIGGLASRNIDTYDKDAQETSTSAVSLRSKLLVKGASKKSYILPPVCVVCGKGTINRSRQGKTVTEKTILAETQPKPEHISALEDALSSLKTTISA